MKITDARVGMIVRSNIHYERSWKRYIVGKIVKIESSEIYVEMLENHNSIITKERFKEKMIIWSPDYLDIYEDKRI